MPEATRGWSADVDRNDLREDRIPADPFALFTDWFEAARSADLIEPTAMTLATADADGRPSARTVLLKGFDADGFRFYTNYESGKAKQLAANPNAALVFWWDKLERQVRIEGEVEKLPPDESDRYFARRPRGSQIGARASVQSSLVPDRQTLEQRFADTEARFADREIPRPENWGGYRLAPTTIEFWQGRANRMHDRIRYRRDGDVWRIERLSP